MVEQEAVDINKGKPRSEKDPDVVRRWAGLEAQLAWTRKETSIHDPIRDLDELESLQLLRDQDDQSRPQTAGSGKLLPLVVKKPRLLPLVGKPRLPQRRTSLENSTIQDFENHHRLANKRVLKDVFLEWIDFAIEPDHWITYPLLPSMLRFAMRRPLMPEGELQRQLQYYGVREHFEILYNDEKRWFGKDRRQLLGIESPTSFHVSGKYSSILPRGRALYDLNVKRDQKRRQPVDGCTEESKDLQSGYRHLSSEEESWAKEIAKIIQTYRSKEISLNDARYEVENVMGGLEMEADVFDKLIQDNKLRPLVIAVTMIEECVPDDSPPLSPTDDILHSHPMTACGNDKSSSTFKLVFDVPSQLKAIYNDVVNGRVSLDSALLKFRSVLGSPEMPDGVLSGHLILHNIPASMFFSDSITGEISSAITNAIRDSEAGLGSSFSSRSSNGSGQVSDFASESQRKTLGLLESESHQETTKIPIRGPCVERFVDIDTEEAELPATFQYVTDAEYKSLLEVAEETNLRASLEPVSTAKLSLSKPVEEDQWSKFSKYNSDGRSTTPPTQGYPMVRNVTPSPSQTNRNTTNFAKVEPNLLLEGTKDLKTSSAKSPPGLKSSNAVVDEWQFLSGSAGNPCHEDYSDANLSNSPETGETQDIWGITMSTQAAKEMGTKLGLPEYYVKTRIRSLTPHRSDARKARKLAMNVTFPPPKRKSSSSQSDGPPRKSPKSDDDNSHFAIGDEDHDAFLNRCVSPYTLRDFEKPRKRCKKCRQYFCVCRTRKASTPDYSSVSPHHQEGVTQSHFSSSSSPLGPSQPLDILDRASVEANSDLWQKTPVSVQKAFDSDFNSPGEVKLLISTEDGQEDQRPREKADSPGERFGKTRATNTNEEAWEDPMESVTRSPAALSDDLGIYSPDLAFLDPIEGIEQTQGTIKLSLAQVAKRIGSFLSGRSSGASPVFNMCEDDAVVQSSNISGPPSLRSDHSTVNDSFEFASPTSLHRTAGLIPTSLTADDKIRGRADKCIQIQDGPNDAESSNDSNISRHQSGHVAKKLSISSSFQSLGFGEGEEPGDMLISPPTPRLRQRALQNDELQRHGPDHIYPTEADLMQLTPSSLSEAQRVAIAAEALALLAASVNPTIPGQSDIASTVSENKENLDPAILGQSDLDVNVLENKENMDPTVPGKNDLAGNDTVQDVIMGERRSPQVTMDSTLAKANFLLKRARKAPIQPTIKRDIRKEASQENMSVDDYLESMRWKRIVAADRSRENRYFQTSNGPSGKSSIEKILNKQFDNYRDITDETSEGPDVIGITGTIKYLGDLGVNLDEVAVLALLTELKAPTMGDLSREGFISGWKSHNAETLSKQQAHVSALRHTLSTDLTLFRSVYKHTFFLARNPGQKAVLLEAAIEYWRLLLQSPSLRWSTSSTPWLTWWIEYLERRWKKSVGKDMWDQTGIFVQKSMEDESMGWWSEDGAWPGVLDEFVVFVKEKREEGEGKMEVE